MFRCLIAGLFLLAATAANAGAIQVKEVEGQAPILHYYGGVTRGDANGLRTYSMLYQPQKIIMTSQGGDAREGYAIASVLSQAQMTVEVPKGYMCMSACAVGFLGGGKKIINGILGFHIAYSRAEIPDGYGVKMGQVFGLVAAYTLIENGYNLLLARMTNDLTSPSDFLVFTTEEELEAFYVRTPYNFAYDYIDIPKFFKDMEQEDFYEWFLERIYPPKELQDLESKQRREVALGISGEEDRPELYEEDE